MKGIQLDTVGVTKMPCRALTIQPRTYSTSYSSISLFLLILRLFTNPISCVYFVYISSLLKMLIDFAEL